MGKQTKGLGDETRRIQEWNRSFECSTSIEGWRDWETETANVESAARIRWNEEEIAWIRRVIGIQIYRLRKLDWRYEDTESIADLGYGQIEEEKLGFGGSIE